MPTAFPLRFHCVSRFVLVSGVFCPYIAVFTFPSPMSIHKKSVHRALKSSKKASKPSNRPKKVTKRTVARRV